MFQIILSMTEASLLTISLSLSLPLPFFLSNYLLWGKLCYCCSDAQSCLILCNPMDYRLPGSSVHFPGRILEWVAIPYCKQERKIMPKLLLENGIEKDIFIVLSYVDFSLCPCT